MVRFKLAMLLTVSLLLAGCSGELESQVSGTVTLDGKALDRGDIAFHPVGSGPTAYGSITDEGEYTVKTGQGTGLKPGDYTVVVKVTSKIEPSTDPTALEQVPELLSPKVYAMKQTSPLRFTVEPGAQTIDIPLQSS